jgi:guanyl-specific ribonuclease Sa
MTDPAGSDRIQQDVPTASGTGDNSDTSVPAEDVPLTREEAVERDARTGDDLPADADSDVAMIERSGPADGL